MNEDNDRTTAPVLHKRSTLAHRWINSIALGAGITGFPNRKLTELWNRMPHISTFVFLRMGCSAL